VIELIVLGATLGAAALAAAVEARRRRGAPRALGEWARSRGHRFTPAAPKAGAPSPRAFGVAGAASCSGAGACSGAGDGAGRSVDEHADVRFTVDFCRVRGDARTRVCAEVARGRVPRLAVVQRSRLERAFASAVPVSGIPDLDEAFVVHGAAAEDARALLGPHLGAFARLDARSHVRLFSDGGRVTLMWAGVETDPWILDAALGLALATAGWRRTDAPYR
jgi:hypothetical protein